MTYTQTLPMSSKKSKHHKDFVPILTSYSCRQQLKDSRISELVRRKDTTDQKSILVELG